MKHGLEVNIVPCLATVYVTLYGTYFRLETHWKCISYRLVLCFSTQMKPNYKYAIDYQKAVAHYATLCTYNWYHDIPKYIPYILYLWLAYHLNDLQTGNISKLYR